jgi:excisionase family DNA binding protein
MKEWFKPTEIAKFFSVNRATVVNWVNSGKLVAYETVGGHYRVMRKDIIDFARKRTLPLPDEFKSAKYRILIVDDEKNVVKSVKMVLEGMGIDLEIETAYDGFEGGMKVSQFLPHLVILDAIMPGADGDRVVRLIRGNEALKDIKILIFTGYPGEGRKLLELGADKVIEKTSPEANPGPFRKEVSKLLEIKYMKVSTGV